MKKIEINYKKNTENGQTNMWKKDRQNTQKNIHHTFNQTGQNIENAKQKSKTKQQQQEQ